MKKIIKSINELTELAKRDEGLECYIILNYGVRSSKFIQYRQGKALPFKILNLIDDSTIYVSKEGLMDKRITLIGEAISKNALVAEN